MTLEYQGGAKSAAIRRIREAMEMASERKCNGCKVAFVKEESFIHNCNRITCRVCGNYQCYLCSTTLGPNYSHFGDERSECPLYGESRIANEVLQAKERTIRNLLRELPELKEEELRNAVSKV